MNNTLSTARFVGGLLVGAGLLASCLAPAETPPPEPTPTEFPTSTPWAASSNPHRTIQICLDRTAGYDTAYFDAAVEMAASGIEELVHADQGGADVFISLITDKSFEDENTLMLIQVPSIPPNPVPPVPVEPPPTATPHISADPLAKASATAARESEVAEIDEHNRQRQAEYERALADQAARIAQASTDVGALTSELRTIDPPLGPQASDILGCISRAAERFKADQADEDTLIMVSDLDGTLPDGTHAPQSGNLETLQLPDVTVRVIFFPAQFEGAEGWEERTKYWTGHLTNAGAADITFADPIKSRVLTLADLLE